MSPIRIERFGPVRPWFRPGCWATIEVGLTASEAAALELHVELLDVDRVMAQAKRRVRVRRGRSVRRFGVSLPDRRRRGYGLRLRVGGPSGRIVARSAVEALDGWWESPRHAALTEFGSVGRAQRAVSSLANWHVTIAQAYDWMYRHYRYEPPSGDAFVDVLGRRVSLAAVRAAIGDGHRAGIASLAYGSVYGAEAEYVEDHPDERVFGPDGEPLGLGDTFFITDLRPGSPWRRRLLREYAGAIRRLAFDGIHMDTYGPPYEARAADGAMLRFTDLYPGLIEEAAAAVAAERPGARVLFNCVDGFPLEAIAPAPAAALYLELWPPDERFDDIVRWVDRARAVADGRAIVIAAYASALRGAAGPAERAQAVESAVLLTSVISAAGAYHHILADGERLLVEGYYPASVRLRATEARELQAAWRFGARYVQLVTDPGAKPAPLDGIELVDGSGQRILTSDRPHAGRVWLQALRTSDGRHVLNLVDLLDQADDRWTTGRQAAGHRSGWQLRWPGQPDCVAMSPWTAGGDAIHLGGDRAGGGLRLPRFRRWLLVATPDQAQASSERVRQ